MRLHFVWRDCGAHDDGNHEHNDHDDFPPDIEPLSAEWQRRAQEELQEKEEWRERDIQVIMKDYVLMVQIGDDEDCENMIMLIVDVFKKRAEVSK